MPRMRLHLSVGDNRRPPRRPGIESMLVTALDHDSSGRVSLEVIGVELYTFDVSSPREPDYCPVVPGSTAPLRLPSVAHVCRPAGKDQVLPVAVVHVAAGDDESAVLHRREVDFTLRREHALVGLDVTMNPQTCDSTVGKNVEPEVRHLALIFDSKLVDGIPQQRDFREKRSPSHLVAAEPAGRWNTFDRCRIDARSLRVVAGEVRSVDYDTANDPGRTESNYRPVVPRASAAARLPAVHPFAALGICPLAPLGRARLEERFLRSEELVIRRQNRAAEALGREIDEVGE